MPKVIKKSDAKTKKAQAASADDDAEETAPKKKEAPKKFTGRTLGLSVSETWKAVFDANAKAASGKKAKLGELELTQPMTDEEITKFLRKEFPGNDSKNLDAVARHRGYYNAGTVAKSQNGEGPDEELARYDAEGNVVVRGERQAARKAKAAEAEEESTPAKKGVIKKKSKAK